MSSTCYKNKQYDLVVTALETLEKEESNTWNPNIIYMIIDVLKLQVFFSPLIGVNESAFREWW